MVFYLSPGRQREVRDKVDFCLVNVPTFAPGTRPETRPLALARRLAELSTYFTFFSFQLPVAQLAYVASVDAALAAGTKDYCLIQNVGHLFYGEAELSVDLFAALDACAFVTGTPMIAAPYFALDPGCVLINRRAWEKLGKPPFGAPGDGTAQFPRGHITDAGIQPVNGTAAVSGSFGYGWNIIAAGLAAGLTVQAWPDTVRRWSHALDTHGGNIAEWLMALDDLQSVPRSDDPKLGAALNFLRNTPDPEQREKKVFVFNTESDADFPTLRYHPGLDRAFVLASGFKGNRILETFGFSDKTEVITYDYSRVALALRQAMVEHWDGRDFAAFFAAQRPLLAARFSDAVAYLPKVITDDPAALTQEFQREIESVFSSPDHWLSHWQRYRALKHHFVLVDIFQTTELEALIAKYAAGHTVIWISDIFNSPNALAKMSWDHRQAIFQTLKAALARTTASDLILGSAPGFWLPNL